MQITGGLTFTGGVNVVSDHDPYWSNVVLLLNTVSTNNTNNFTYVDSSDNNLTITQYNSTPQGSYSPFTTKPYLTPSYSTAQNGGSAYLNGTNMYLTVANNSVMAFGTGDFTTEAWVRVPAAANAGATTDRLVIGSWNWSGATPLLFFIENKKNYASIWNGTTQYDSNVSVSANTWTHVAWVRKSGNLSFYVNGTLSGPANTSMTTNFSAANTLYIAKSSNSNDRYFSTQMASLRVSNSAVYTSNFTTSTTPLTKTANTCLLMNFTNAGMYDVSNNQWLLSSPNTTTNTTTTKFGPSSAYFTGNVSSLVNGSDFSCSLGTNNFTIEAWVYPTTANTTLSLTGLCDSTPNAANTSFRMNISTTNKLISNVCSGTTAYACTSTGNISANTWTHIAFVRNGATLTQYINGTADGSNNIGAATSVNSAAGFAFSIGRQGAVASNYFQGYIEQYRLTNGVARYTSNFTAPTSAFPTF